MKNNKMFNDNNIIDIQFVHVQLNSCTMYDEAG